MASRTSPIAAAPRPKPNTRITSEQERAAAGWNASEKSSEEFVKLCKSAPALMMASGLMATLAFLRGKAKKKQGNAETPHGTLCGVMCAWIEKRAVTGGGGYEAVQTILLHASPREYRLITEETQGLLAWLRHFAAARGKEA